MCNNIVIVTSVVFSSKWNDGKTPGDFRRLRSAPPDCSLKAPTRLPAQAVENRFFLRLRRFERGYGYQTSAIHVHATDERKRHAVAALDRYAENHGRKLATNEKSRPIDPL